MGVGKPSGYYPPLRDPIQIIRQSHPFLGQGQLSTPAESYEHSVVKVSLMLLTDAHDQCIHSHWCLQIYGVSRGQRLRTGHWGLQAKKSGLWGHYNFVSPSATELYTSSQEGERKSISTGGRVSDHISSSHRNYWQKGFQWILSFNLSTCLGLNLWLYKVQVDGKLFTPPAQILPTFNVESEWSQDSMADDVRGWVGSGNSRHLTN